MNIEPNRRTFLQQASTRLVGLTALSAKSALGNSPDRKLTVGLIGCGGRGTHDTRLFKNSDNVEIAYVCDPDAGRLASAAKSFAVPADRAISDLRRMLDDSSLDAVIVGTPDHWHSPAAILACEAGKHVYVEKPISHNVREGRLLVEAAAGRSKSSTARTSHRTSRLHPKARTT